jgi:hypothetical protein
MSNSGTTTAPMALNYSADDLAAFKQKHDIVDQPSTWAAEYAAAVERIERRKASAAGGDNA